MKHRLVILAEIIAPYRIPVFNALARHPEVEAHVIFLSETDPSLRQWPIYREEIRFSYEVLPYWRRRIGSYNVLLNRGLNAALERAAPNAMLCGGYSYLSSWTAGFWVQRHHVPLLLWCESTLKDARNGHFTVEFLKAHFLDRCNAFVVSGKSSLAYLTALGVSEGEVFTAPNAVDINFFAHAARDAQSSPDARAQLGLPDRYFLYVGRLVAEKGIFELLEAYAKLEADLRAAIGLVFVGDGPQKNELMRRISSLESGTLRCFGFMHREQLAKFYGLAEAFIFPTHTDAWGLVVNEAMACGLPVITTNVAGCAADLVQVGWNGFVVPPQDVLSLTAAMALLARQPELRVQMGIHSRQHIQSYSPEACADGMAKAVRFACEGAS